MLEDDVNIVARSDDAAHDWGADAPKGGRTVLQRILKEGTKVPLFLGQTLVNSLRDVGYNDTVSAVCEHVDNSLQWDATEVRVYFAEEKQRGATRVDVLVLDNGRGMAPHVLQVATSFGGSMVYENRKSIGRYGVGMKAAALSMSPMMELYSWQEPGAFYRMVLDVQEISNSRSNLIELPEPQFMNTLPSNIARILTRPMNYPKNPSDTQALFTSAEDDLLERLGPSGTMVFMPNCDRLTYKNAKTLVDHAVKDMARVYRRYIEKGVKLYVNNRRVEASDPTYWMTTARHAKVEGLKEKRSRLIRPWPRIEIPIAEGSETKAPVSVRLYRLPIEEWSELPEGVIKSGLQIYDDYQVSFMRADREVYAGPNSKLKMPAHGDTKWMRLQVDFPAELDEAFGVAMNKQGVRPKGYVLDIIRKEIEDEVRATRKSIAESRAAKVKEDADSPASQAEKRANATDGLQGKQLPTPAPETAEERQMLDENLRGLAVTLKRDGETDEQAFERIRGSTYVTIFRHDPYWPFYHVEYKFGRVILTINTAHPFYTRFYQPLVDFATAPATDGAEDTGEQPGDATDLVVSLQLMLLSLARTQSQMMASGGEDRRMLFDTFGREWSNNMKVQLGGE
ncbi:Histidine kinase-, DNA gyrase B-, and HSP90-like ATPase [Sphingomonas palmae]|uniref:Histidine kinase-, DNA gyrase B-, and HSP90-like ATPase n=1 Tax=Sphingomonas palmae TaxID=1855283 RepID=A0A1H7T2F0_9SPHN|nr:ATP-binding protein [Sphingomonas palmae]SEL79041.1 Histidine kinase-, DNA gyrase B-, and HSP90-like ATPase [Sphingomonas palmae]